MTASRGNSHGQFSRDRPPSTHPVPFPVSAGVAGYCALLPVKFPAYVGISCRFLLSNRGSPSSSSSFSRNLLRAGWETNRRSAAFDSVFSWAITITYSISRDPWRASFPVVGKSRCWLYYSRGSTVLTAARRTFFSFSICMELMAMTAFFLGTTTQY